MFFTYFLNDFEMVSLAPIITEMTFVFTFHMRCIIIIIIFFYGCFLSQIFSSWYFSWTNGDPHRSGFKLDTAVLSILCVMFQLYLSFVVNLSNVFRAKFQFFLSFPLLYYYYYYHHHHHHHYHHHHDFSRYLPI
jgi:hypothetical protein